MLELRNAFALERRNAPLELRNAPTVTPEMKKLLEDIRDRHNATVAKQDRTISDMQKRLDDAILEAKRPLLNGEVEHKALPQGWDDYLRKGSSDPDRERLSLLVVTSAAAARTSSVI